MNILDIKGKSRAITIPPDVKHLWEQIQHILRDPVIRRYTFPDDIHLEKKTAEEKKLAVQFLNLAISLTDEEKLDERVMISINEMLEEYVWKKMMT